MWNMGQGNSDFFKYYLSIPLRIYLPVELLIIECAPPNKGAFPTLWGVGSRLL